MPPKRPFVLLTVSLACCAGLRAADLPPDKGDQIPPTALRETVVSRKGELPAVPAHSLPEGYTLDVVAAAPLVVHPIMGCVDDRGRLFIGDAVGVNWNKEQLEKKPPNRVLLLEDADQDGKYDRSTVFADNMTFPQGAAWLNGSLYVCSPPGLWKLTDTNNDGIAEEREMIVSGFDYTGNAADVHGPKVHPNGRLYWCHGRKGHRVVGKEGTVVHEGKASGIWSCRPDGSDVQWHSLGCADNPTGLAITLGGDLLGTCNLYYSNPRGDTLMHWLYGGVYERADQMQAIAGLPRTLDVMPVIHNFGHVAVSGCSLGRYEGGITNRLHLYITHFNTQRLVRMELTPDGSTFKAAENEFLKIQDPDVHLTDVVEDRDGSLLVLNTGGWFRIGCPASLMAKPDMLGCVYRIRPLQPKTEAQTVMTGAKVPSLDSSDLHEKRKALEELARGAATDIALENLPAVLAGASDPALEHAAILACVRQLKLQADARTFVQKALQLHQAARKGRDAKDKALEESFASPQFAARVLRVADLCGLRDETRNQWVVEFSVRSEPAFFKPAMAYAAQEPELARQVMQRLGEQLDPAADVSAIEKALLEKRRPVLMAQLETLLPACLDQPEAQSLITRLLQQPDGGWHQCALRILAGQTSLPVQQEWLPLLSHQLGVSPSPLLLDVLKKLRSPSLDGALQALAAREELPLTIRLKALDAVRNVRLEGSSFDLVKKVLSDASASPAARIQAAGMMAAAALPKEKVTEIAPLFAQVGPVELKALLPVVRKARDAEAARLLAEEIAKNPVLASQQESAYRTAFSDQPPEVFEKLIHPAYARAVEALDAKKRLLAPLADKAVSQGKAAEGKKHFEMGKGTCIACHKVGNIGRALGPDLSKIGAIRTERDLLESILFPSNTLARDYEAHILETRDGQATLGVIRSHTAEGLLVMDVAGQEKSLPHDQILSNTTLTTSLMPMGLDSTMPEQELLDLVAYLRSLR